MIWAALKERWHTIVTQSRLPPNFYTLMKTLTLTQRREILAKAWKNYVTIRRAYCNRKATVQQLAHALALVGVAEVKAEILRSATPPCHPRRSDCAVEKS